MVVLYKRGALDANATKALRKAGYTPVRVNGLFGDIQFRMAGGIGFEDDMGDMQLMILKAALDQTYFPDAIGKQIVAKLRAKVKAADPQVKP